MLARKSTNLSLDSKLVTAARELDVNLSRAAEAGIRDALRRRRAEQWQSENRGALESSNTYVETNGLPLARHRMF